MLGSTVLKVSAPVCGPQDEAQGQLGALQREVEQAIGDRDGAQRQLAQLQSTLQECQEGTSAQRITGTGVTYNAMIILLVTVLFGVVLIHWRATVSCMI